MPLDSSHSVMRALASTTPRPSRETSSPEELTIFASYEAKASSQVDVSVPRSSEGSTTQRIGSSKARAKAKSRVSCAGTAMMAPVP
ncbi:hypothetical protein SGLAM104S_04677 [Streptomyces glaucescens]